MVRLKELDSSAKTGDSYDAKDLRNHTLCALVIFDIQSLTKCRMLYLLTTLVFKRMVGHELHCHEQVGILQRSFVLYQSRD